MTVPYSASQKPLLCGTCDKPGDIRRFGVRLTLWHRGRADHPFVLAPRREALLALPPSTVRASRPGARPE